MLAGELVALRYYGAPLLARFEPLSFAMPSDLACFRTNAALALGYHLSPAAISASSCAFMYPPPFFLLTAPLAWAGARWAFMLWSLFGVALLTLAARTAKFSWRAAARQTG